MGKNLHYKQEVAKTFVIPLIASAIMGVTAYLSYTLLFWICKSNAVSVAIAIGAAVAVYGFCLLRFRCFSKSELYDLPMGGRIVWLAQKLKMLP